MTKLRGGLLLALLIIVCLNFTTTLLAQVTPTRVIEGVVKDNAREPLASASIALGKGAQTVMSSQDGTFRLSVPLGTRSQLTVSSIGFITQQVQVTDQSGFLEIILEAKDSLSEEVVVMAYGQRKRKSEIVGSAFQITSEQIKNLPAGRVDALLNGQIPGLSVTPNTDDATSTKQRLNLRIRGDGSFSASREPLWIVDGVPIFTGNETNMIAAIQTSVSPLSYINPADIESITVLKDASAAAIYGANASNGVILVTTKAGSSGKLKFTANLQTGFSKINQSSKFKALNGSEYLELAKESFLNAGKDLATFPYTDNEINKYSTTDTDWSDIFYGTGTVNNATLSLSGGVNKFSYSLSGGYFKEQSTIIGNSQERKSISANIGYKLLENLDLRVISRASFNNNDIFNPGRDYLEFLPIISPYNEDGSFRQFNRKITGVDLNGNIVYSNTRFFNSLAEREENDNRQKGFLFNNNFLVRYKVLKDLNSTTQYGVDMQEIKENTYAARTNWSGVQSDGTPVGYAAKAYNKTITKTFIERLNYNKTLGRHSLGGIFGLELKSFNYRTSSLSAFGFDDDSKRDPDLAREVLSSQSSRRERKDASFFGQLDYNFDKRYYIEFTGRRDGSSAFGAQARWGNFASAGVAWDLKNESFLSNIDAFSALRLAATFGSTGNSRLSGQEAYGIYTISNNYNYNGQQGAVIFNIPNPLLRWESAYQTNFKLDLGLFNRLNILLEAYNKKTVQAIIDVAVSRATGETAAQSNTGELQNQGIEATINWRILQRKNSKFWVEVRGAHNKNKVLTLYNSDDRTNGNYIWREGQDMRTFYLIRWAGVDPRDGAPLWYDVNGNITRVYDINNRVAGKTANPDLFGGVSLGYEYKSFALNALFTYTVGGYQFGAFARNMNSDGLNIETGNQSVNQLDRWQQPGDIALSPKPIWGISTRSTMNSTRYIYKTTNMRLSNLALSYKLPVNTFRSVGIKQTSVTLIGNNLLLLTPYDKSNRNSFKQAMSGYPMETSFLLSLNLNF